MSSVPADKLDATEKAQLACTYAALILHSDEQEIDAGKLNRLITGAGLKIENFWATLFAKTLANSNINDLLTAAPGGDSGAPAAGAAPAGGAEPAKDAGKGAAKKEEPKKEEKKPQEEEEDPGMFGLFD